MPTCLWRQSLPRERDTYFDYMKCPLSRSCADSPAVASLRTSFRVANAYKHAEDNPKVVKPSVSWD